MANDPWASYWQQGNADSSSMSEDEIQKLIDQLMTGKRPVQKYPYPQTSMPMNQTQSGGAGGGNPAAGYGQQGVSMLQNLGFFGGGSGSTTAGGVSTSLGPYAALAAAIAAFGANDKHMSKGSGKTSGGEMQDAWSESFGNNGIWGAIKGLF